VSLWSRCGVGGVGCHVGVYWRWAAGGLVIGGWKSLGRGVGCGVFGGWESWG